MIRKITVKAGQILNDIALQELGSTDGMLAIVRLNNLGSISDNIYAGQELLIDDSKIVDTDTQGFMKELEARESYVVATDEEEESEEVVIDGTGIGHDRIGVTNVIG